MIPPLASNLPPAFVVGAHYDTFLQRALRRFFERATLETELRAFSVVGWPPDDRSY